MFFASIWTILLDHSLMYVCYWENFSLLLNTLLFPMFIWLHKICVQLLSTQSGLSYLSIVALSFEKVNWIDLACKNKPCEQCTSMRHTWWAVNNLQTWATTDNEQWTTYVTGPAKINHRSIKNCQFCSYLFYYNSITIYTTAKNLLHHCKI